MRTGSIGNRDAESIVNTLEEPKKKALTELRAVLLGRGFLEEIEYDAINVESYISYSIANRPKFIIKFKWEFATFLIIENQIEQRQLLLHFHSMEGRQFETNSDDGTIWVKLDPVADQQLIMDLVNFYCQPKKAV
jgi:hypothetical protein